ncbi:3-beta hydroxysteroid dehydrogenase [halophilic archaeon]|nr:3-beta hydroxysteroid dehydrogenase [halophilic archaeon]
MTDVERILLAGASGGTGTEILDLLADAEFAVRALTHTPEKAHALRSRGADEVVVGDLLESGDAARAVAGCDVVLSAVGTRSPVRMLVGDLVDGTGVENLVDAAVAADVDRFVFESAIGVGDSRGQMPAAFRLLIWRVLAAKNRAEAALRTSRLSHTVVRPGMLTNDPATGDVLVGEGGATVSGSIPRADVARLMVAAPFTPESENRTFEVVSRDGLRGTARGLVDVDWQSPVEEEIAVEE